MPLSANELKRRTKFYRIAAMVLFCVGFLLMIASTLTGDPRHPTGASAVLRIAGYLLMGLGAMSYFLSGWFHGLGGS